MRKGKKVHHLVNHHLVNHNFQKLFSWNSVC